MRSVIQDTHFPKNIGTRILVIGCCGAGKSTFARQLSRVTGVPLIHLDQHFWRPGWTEPDRESWAHTVANLISEPRWIIDGNYLGTLPMRLSKAETVIFLDPPRRVCLWRSVVRIVRHFGRTRDDMASNCPERFKWAFLMFIWNFPRDHRPQILEALRNFSGKVITYKIAPTFTALVSSAQERSNK